jgi:F-type H+-transporting ATPase subunit epsilon
MPLRLSIITPNQTLIHEDVDYVSATGVEGEFGVLPGHAPLLAALCIGPLHFRIGDKAQYVFIGGGFLEVLDNKVTVLGEAAELAKDIDTERAGKARERAERRLSRRGADVEHVDEARAHAALSRAVVRMRVASMQ